MFVRLAFFPNATAADFDRLAERMSGVPKPVGRLLFAAGPVDGGWQVVQVWSSRAGLDEFNQGHFLPALRSLGAGAFPAPPVVKDFVPTSVDIGSL